MKTKFMIGNWKMNQGLADIKAFIEHFDSARIQGNFIIAPQSIYINYLKDHANNFKVASQNTASELSGAFTGELSPSALIDFDINYAIVGHSERRTIYNESDSILAQKTALLLEKKITPIFCIGETKEQRQSGETFKVLESQLKIALGEQKLKSDQDIIIAYEPVWAIGTGLTATPDMANEAHIFIEKTLSEIFPSFGAKISILYGGSVKPSNVKELLAQSHIDGALVGGASLKADSFLELCKETI